MSRVGRWLARLGLLLGGLLVGLLLAEGGARLVAPEPAAELLGEPTRDATPGLYLTDERLGHVPAPGYQRRWPTAGGWNEVRITAQGYRGPEARPELPRWIAVGDSYTIGVQVPEEATFSARLGARRGWSVINGGADGYSTWQSALRYAALDDALDAQGALYLLFEGNDLTDNGVFLSRMRMSTDGQGGLVMPPKNPHFRGEPLVPWRPPSLEEHLRARSLLLSALHVLRHRPEVVQRGTLDRYRRETVAMTRPGRGERVRLLEDLRAALRFLRRTAEERGDRLLVALAPAPWMLDPAQAEATLVALGQQPGMADVDAFRADVAATVRAEGLDACDLGPALRASAERGEEPYLRYDGHFSRQGHEVVAQALDDCLPR